MKALALGRRGGWYRAAVLLAAVGCVSLFCFQPTSVLQNAGFEQSGGALPSGWTRDTNRTGKMGSALQDVGKAHSGKASLRLDPSSRNGGDSPLAVFQLINGERYRGKRVDLSAYIATRGGAAAVVGMLAIVNGAPVNLSTAQPAASPDWTEVHQLYDVPDKPGVQLAFICMVYGQSGSAWFDDVSLADRSAERAQAEQRGNSTPGAAHAGAVKATVSIYANRVVRKIPRTLYGTNVEWRWNANLLWQEKQQRVDPELLRLTREMGVTLIRYPGGVYSDFYHWEQGIGPLDRRPQVLHEPGKDDKSRPNFGTDEALEFARAVNAELLITVNVGTGTAQEAADWVRYVNGKGRRVRFWEVGNEVYINDNTPISRANTMDPGRYAAKFVEFARAMRAADPGISIGAIGGENRGRYSSVSYPNWDRIVLERAGSEMDFFAVHNSYAPLINDDRPDLRTIYRAMLAAPVDIKKNLDTIAGQIRTYAPGRADHIKIAVTEWGPAFQFDFRTRYADHSKTLGSALFAASALKALIEHPKTEMANFWLLNDVSFLGWIGSSSAKFPPEPRWTPTARYYAFQLFTQHFGDRVVESQVQGPTFDSQAAGMMDAIRGAPSLEVVSSLSADGRTLYVIGINKDFDFPIEAVIGFKEFRPAATGNAWVLNGASLDANTGTRIVDVPGLRLPNPAQDSQNPRFQRGGPGEVSLSQARVAGVSERFSYSFPAHSVTALAFERAGDRPR
jgi:alpha-N-arabinofuranosidase